MQRIFDKETARVISRSFVRRPVSAVNEKDSLVNPVVLLLKTKDSIERWKHGTKVNEKILNPFQLKQKSITQPPLTSYCSLIQRLFANPW